MKDLKSRIVTATFVLAMILAAPSAFAINALSFTGGSDYSWPGASIGWEFSISEPITVTALGVYDNGADGLTESHEVGIFPAGVNSLLFSTTVTTTDPLQNGFRYASISPVVLTPGNYVVAARMPTSSDLGAAFANQVTAPEITYVQEWYLYSPSFELPTDSWNADGGNFGGSFQFDVGAVAPTTTGVPTLTQSMLMILIVLVGFIGISALSARST